MEFLVVTLCYRKIILEKVLCLILTIFHRSIWLRAVELRPVKKWNQFWGASIINTTSICKYINLKKNRLSANDFLPDMKVDIGNFMKKWISGWNLPDQTTGKLKLVVDELYKWLSFLLCLYRVVDPYIFLLRNYPTL